MIVIKGQDEAALVARIEKELKGEEVDIFQSDDTQYSMEEVLAFLGYNAKQARIYIGRLERNSRRIDEDLREANKLLEPVSMYFSALVEDMLPEHMLTIQQRKNKKDRQRWVDFENEQQARRDALTAEKLRKDLEEQRAISERLREEGKAPEQE